MARKGISRRRFVEGTVLSGLAFALSEPIKSLSLEQSHEGASPRLSLKVTGNAADGYGVEILRDDVPIARHRGEISAVFQNADRSLADSCVNWKATGWKGDSTHVELTGQIALKNLNGTVFVRIQYDLVTPYVIRKIIRLHQADSLVLFYQMANTLLPAEPPAKFWSFDQSTCKGGPLHEYFPAAGFRTRQGVTVGLLTDAGFRNQWTRLIRRDGLPVKPAPRIVPDTNLYSLSNSGDFAKGDYFVRQTFGEAKMQAESDPEKIQLPRPASWKKIGDPGLTESEGVAILSLRAAGDGVLIPFPALPGETYAVRVEYRAPAAITVELWDIDERLVKVNDATLFNDTAPASPAAWSRFETTVFLAGLAGSQGALVISAHSSEESSENPSARGPAEVRGIEVRRVSPRSLPYHRLEMDHEATRTGFIFVDGNVSDTLRGYRLASQLHLADALGFKGGDTEKVVYSDLMMLSWIAGPENFQPICAPSIWYSAAGEMYLRDSFFALNGIYNRELNEKVFNLWAENQGADGAINTLIEPNLANLERKSNDSTPLWLIWALLNRRRFGTIVSIDKLRKAATYCLSAYDPDRSGICRAQFVMGQLDVIRYPQGTSVICENQGLLAVMLRVIQELKIPQVSETITEDYINKAESAYASYYDPALQFFRPARDISDAIGFAEIFPEYLSLWLFKRKMLTDEMVTRHLDHIPLMMPRADAPYPKSEGTVRPILIGLPEGGKSGWRYFTEKWHPMVSDSFAANYANHAMDGVYYNGGSWMRLEICGYVTGKFHGWSKWKEAIANRLWAELNIAADFPTSQEYLATAADQPFFGFHRVFAWNAFVLQSLELAGLRTPGMDPDFAVGSTSAPPH